jgi:hypothetical protein
MAAEVSCSASLCTRGAGRNGATRRTVMLSVQDPGVAVPAPGCCVARPPLLGPPPTFGGPVAGLPGGPVIAGPVIAGPGPGWQVGHGGGGSDGAALTSPAPNVSVDRPTPAAVAAAAAISFTYILISQASMFSTLVTGYPGGPRPKQLPQRRTASTIAALSVGGETRTATADFAPGWNWLGRASAASADVGATRTGPDPSIGGGPPSDRR